MKLKKIFLLLIIFLCPFAYAENKTAVFAGGCFWCMQADFDKLPGVIKTTAGFDGGQTPNPTYEQVSSGTTDYIESLQVIYDDSKITYPELLNYFWHHIDPTVENKQFCDIGKQYRTVIFYSDKTQKKQALKSLDDIKKQFKIIYTQIIPSTHFYPAEDYHQDYYKKNPVRYEFYRWNCGRDRRLKEIWDVKA